MNSCNGWAIYAQRNGLGFVAQETLANFAKLIQRDALLSARQLCDQQAVGDDYDSAHFNRGVFKCADAIAQRIDKL